MTKKKEREALVASIRTFWASADTHLDHAVSNPAKTAADRNGRAFHAKCVIEYLDAMRNAAEALI